MITKKRELSDSGYLNAKVIILEGLQGKVDEEFGDELKIPFEFTLEYPSNSTQEVDDKGNVLKKRRIVARRLDTENAVDAIGDEYFAAFSTTQENIDGTEDARAGLRENVGYGWVESWTIELSVWTFSPLDRDNCIALINQWMLELTHNSFEGGVPYFYSQGILSAKFVRAYEDNKRRDLASNNNSFYIGSIVWEVMVPFFGMTSTEYERYKYILRSSIINFDPTPIKGGNQSLDTGCIDC